MLVFDTADLRVRDRADAMWTAMLEATLSTHLVHHDPSEVWLRIDSFALGGVDLTKVRTSGMTTTRTAGRRPRTILRWSR